jgi:hypothetical protein
LQLEVAQRGLSANLVFAKEPALRILLTLLTPPRTQYGATLGKAEWRLRLQLWWLYLCE